MTTISKSRIEEIANTPYGNEEKRELACLLLDAEAKLEATQIAVAADYFASLVDKARMSADKAMRKYPQPNYVLLKVAEEAGEVVQAGVHYAENRMSWDKVEGEIIQLLAMLIRLVTEGDQVNGITPPDSYRSAMLPSSTTKPAPELDIVAKSDELSSTPEPMTGIDLSSAMRQAIREEVLDVLNKERCIGGVLSTW